MAEKMSGLDMVREIIGQINNLRKLVTVNGKQYKYDPKSKSYKAGGRTFTPSQLKAQLEGQSYTAPKIDNKSKIKIKPKLKRTGKLYPGGISRPDKGRYGRNLPSKDKYGVPSQKKRLLKPKTTPKASVKTKLGNAANTVKKNLKIKNVKNVARNLKGTVGKGAVYGLVQHGANKIVDDTLANIFKRKGETTAEYQARVEKAKANLGKKRVLKPKTKVFNRRGRVIRKKLKTWKDPYKGPKQPEIKSDDKKTTSKKDITIKPKKTNNNKKQVSVGNMIGATATVPKKKLTTAQKEANEKKEWLKKSRNSPAAKAFGNSPEANEKRWQLQKAYREKYKKKRGW